MPQYHMPRKTLYIPDPPPWNYDSGIANLNLDDAIHRHCCMVIDYCAGDLTWAAQELGVSRSCLYNMRTRWEAKQRGTSEEHQARPIDHQLEEAQTPERCEMPGGQQASIDQIRRDLRRARPRFPQVTSEVGISGDTAQSA